uniref:Uncharacterized protein n=1 Tax=Octopus bimaculoides TaxID=37653 RepID=A0A0L8GZZ6_OCTBM
MDDQLKENMELRTERLTLPDRITIQRRDSLFVCLWSNGSHSSSYNGDKFKKASYPTGKTVRYRFHN